MMGKNKLQRSEKQKWYSILNPEAGNQMSIKTICNTLNAR
jgi:hypothetical protein